VFRIRAGQAEVLLVHPGGPYWAKKDLGAWSIPKGELDEGDADELHAARREFQEELGIEVQGEFTPLAEVRQPSGKVVVPFLVRADVDVAAIESNSFEMEWPPKSGKLAKFPEVDRAAYFPLAEARQKILAGQLPILDELARFLASGIDSP